MKGNQGSVHEDVKLFLESETDKLDAKQITLREEVDGEHGRIETRRYYVSEQLEWYPKKQNGKI